jgi:hypothetical protein
VEKANLSAAQRWWRTLPDEVSPAQAQARLDAWCARKGDARRRVRDGERTTVGARFGRVQLLRAPPNTLRECRWGLHLDNNNQGNPESSGWIVRV